MFRRSIAVLLCGALATLPVAARAEDPSPSPPPSPGATLTPTPTEAVVAATPHTETVYRRPRPELLAPGLVLFVAGWVGDIGFTYGYHHDPAWHALIPVVGPFWQLTERYGLDGPPVNTGSADADARINKNIDSANTTIRVLALTGAALSAAFQLAGLGLTIAGAVTKKAHRQYAHIAPDVGPASRARAAARPDVSITASGLRFRF